MQMKLTWITNLPFTIESGSLTATLASTRYRVFIPAQTLSARGYVVSILSVLSERIEDESLNRLLNSDIIIFGKSKFNINIELARKAKNAGICVVVDICDNHFDDDNYGKLHSELATLADCVVGNSDRMANVLVKYAKSFIAVVPDSYENIRRTPRFSPQSDKIKLLWYGHTRNVNALSSVLDSLMGLSSLLPIEFKIVTRPKDEILAYIEKINSQKDNRFRLSFRPWSLDTMVTEFSQCDIVVLPNERSEKSDLRSANRVIEALWSGRYVVATPVASYMEFSPWIYIGDDLSQGIQAALADPVGTREKIAAAQEYIALNYSPERIADRWEVVFNALMEQKQDKRRQTPVLKLNLGCGDKILEGYVNVDVAESRGGKTPDVICDLRQLSSFKNDTADEILSVHVVEHFWRWEVLDVLKEWVRVLKPGGKMIVECPNLLSAAEELLRNPEVASGSGKEGQRSMWVFYGDPAWKDPLMIHRWGYTPQSLAVLMREAGLVNIRQEPAQFKLREPRDMRLIGEKAASA